MTKINIDLIYKKLFKVFSILDLDNSQSRIIIKNLVSSEILNKNTHGLILLTHIIPALIDSPYEDTVWNWKNSHLHCKANNHLGYLALGEAIEKICLEASKTKGVAIATLAKISHAGRLGHYSYEISKQNLIGIVFAHSNPWVAAPAGNKAILGSVAFSAAIPFTNPPIIIDFTPNIATAGEVRLRSLDGKKFSMIIGIDSQGNPTNDPNDVLNNGALKTIGEHKGFVIALLISIFSTLIGGDAVASVKKGYGYVGIAIHPDYLGIGNYIERCQTLVDEVKKSGSSIHLPGENYTLLDDESISSIEIQDRVIDIINGLDNLNTKQELKKFLQNFDKSINLKK